MPTARGRSAHFAAVFVVSLLPALRLDGGGAEKPLETTICGLAANPSSFDGKMVRLEATVQSGFEVLGLADPGGKCAGICLTYPGGGPVASVTVGARTPPSRPPLALKEDARLEEFRKYVGAVMYPRSRGSLCLACYRYQVTAVVTGRLDYAAEEGTGFGHLNQCRMQLVLESVQSLKAADRASKYDAKRYSTEPVRFPAGYLQGRLLSPSGEALTDAPVQLESADDVPLYLTDFHAVTDARGSFHFEVPPGTYVLGVNIDRPPSPKLPYPAFYYPGVGESARASRIEVADRQRIDDLTLRLPPPLPERKLRVSVRWPDGKPAAEASVSLAEVDRPTEVVGGAVSHTGADGEVVLVGFQGIDYFVDAVTFVQPGYVPYCAAKARLNAGDTTDSLEMILTRQEEACRGRRN